MFPAERKGRRHAQLGRQSRSTQFAKKIPWLLGGSADLAPSTKTLLTFEEAGGGLSADNPGGRNLHFGIREHGMAAAVNGMVLCGLRAYGATFFVFSDYCRPSLRLAAIMKIPTHLRLHARFDRRRRRRPDASAGRAPGRLPGDSEPGRAAARRRERNVERLESDPRSRRRGPWRSRSRGKTCRRSTARSTRRPTASQRGGYILADAKGGKPDVILLATGSELQLAVAAHEELTRPASPRAS